MILKKKIPNDFYKLFRTKNREAYMQFVTAIYGLALVHEIAVLHGGSVRAEPGNKSGTVFIVTLPAGDDPC